MSAPLTLTLDLPEHFILGRTEILRMGRLDPTVILEKHGLLWRAGFTAALPPLKLQSAQVGLMSRFGGSLPKRHSSVCLHYWVCTDVFQCLTFGNEKPQPNAQTQNQSSPFRFPFLSTALLSHVLQQQIAWRDAAKIWKVCNRHGHPADGPHGLKFLFPFNFSKCISCETSLPICWSHRKSNPLLREIGRLAWRIDDWYADSELRPMPAEFSLFHRWVHGQLFHALAVSMGEPDVIVTGDYTLPHTVSWALIGKPRSTDNEMKSLLMPFAGNRWRLVRLLWALNIAAPRRGPRLSSSHTRRW